jgi:hypothetical protein
MNVANIAPGNVPPSRFSKQNLFFPRLDYHINSRNDAFVDYTISSTSTAPTATAPRPPSPTARRAPTGPPAITSASWSPV